MMKTEEQNNQETETAPAEKSAEFEEARRGALLAEVLQLRKIREAGNGRARCVVDGAETPSCRTKQG